MRKETLLIICFLVLLINSADFTSKAHAQIGHNALGNATDSGGELLELTEEVQVDSDIHRRILAQEINYNSLNPDRAAVSTSKAGQPYTRPCTAFYRC
jgi:hypothetical protein